MKIRRRTSRLWAAVWVLLLATLPPIQGGMSAGRVLAAPDATVALIAIQDTWISENGADDNYGGCNELTMDSTGSGLGQGRMLVQFDLTSIPQGSTITSAHLQLTKTGGSEDGQLVSAYHVLKAWDEGAGNCGGGSGAANWTERQPGVDWGYPGGNIFPLPSDNEWVSAHGVYSWALKSSVQAWVNNPDANYGVMVASFVADDLFRFASREHGSSALRPQLLVTYDPSVTAIAGNVWADDDRDGAQNGGESGTHGVSVDLHAGTCGELTALPIDSVATGPDGSYHFAVNTGQDYCVFVDEATLPPNLATTTGNSPADITETDLALDFGYATVLADERLTASLYAPCTDIGWLQTSATNHGASFIHEDFSACTFTLGVAPANLPALRDEVLTEIRARAAGPDIYTAGAFLPDDPDYSDPGKVYAPQQINAEMAWDMTTGDPALIAAVLDTGIDAAHPEFAGRLLPGYDFVNDDATPADDHGHGTHVAGILGAGIDNGIGLAGISGDVQVMPLKVLNDKNVGWWSDIAAAITYAVDNGAKVINLSITGSSDSTALRDAIAYANSKGAVVIAAAGNDGTDALRYPASFDSVIAVGATDYNGGRWSLANFGPNVDVMAPGQFIHSTASGSGYAFMTGTSMAAPHVAGTAALLLSVDPNLTPAKIKAVLQETATDMGEPGVDAYHGYGRIDAGAAVEQVAAAALIPPTTYMTATLAVDINGNVLINPGDTVRYEIVVANNNPAPLPNVTVSATVPANTNYASTSTRLNGIPVLDNSLPATPFPLDEGGLNIGSVPANNSSKVTYDAVVGSSPDGVYRAIADATVTSDVGTENLRVEPEVAGTLLKLDVDKANAMRGDALNYAVTTDYLGDAHFQNLVVTAPIPAGATYAPGSANASGSKIGEMVTWNLGANTAGESHNASGGWQYRRKLTFDNSAQTENLTDFPVLVTLNSSRVDYANTQDSGADIRFYDRDGALLAHEIEQWNESGTSYLWVKVPQVDASSNDDFIWMDYGNSSALDGQNAAAVWDSHYKGVWHLNETSGIHIDATSNNNDGTPKGGVSQSAVGQIDGADSFNGGDYVSIGAPASLNISGDITVEAWVNVTAEGAGTQRPILGKGGHQYQIRAGDENDLEFFVWNGSSWTEVNSNDDYTVGQWHYLVGRHSGSEVAVWVDGAKQTQTKTGSIATSPDAVEIGRSSDATTRDFHGSIDEARISNVARSDAWIAAQYKSMTDAFVTYGAETSNDENLSNLIAAAPTLVTADSTLTVTQVLTASINIPNVKPNTLVFTGTNGVLATLVSGPTPAVASVGAAGTTFTWVYAVSGSGNIGHLTFGGDASDGATIWPWAASNSVIVHPPLTFGVTVNDPPGVSVVQATAFVDDDGGLLPSHASNTTVTQLPASIGDRIWNDADGDRIQDLIEDGLGGVTVELHDSFGGTIPQITGVNGSYDFIDLIAGTYTVTVDMNTLPPEYEFITTQHPLAFTVGDGQDINQADFGFKARSSSIGDSIWYDADGNGLQGPGEPGIGNVTLELWRDDGDGKFEPVQQLGADDYVGWTVSNAAGAYRLDTPVDGSYFVDVTDDNGILNGLAHPLGPQSVSDPSPPIPVVSGQVVQDVDFGYVRVPGSGHAVVGDLLWADGDGNGQRSLDEPILIGVEVCATPTAGGGDICATTDINGRYLLEIPVGEYDIAPVNPPVGLAPTTPQPHRVTLADDDQYLDADFGYGPDVGTFGRIGGQVWQDLPVEDVYDGLFDSVNEPGIPGVSTDLIVDLDNNGEWDEGEPYVAVTSDLGGEYWFEGLLAGNYLVRVSDTLGALRNFAPTLLPTGGSATTDGTSKDQPYGVALGAGATDATADFGYREYEVTGAGDPPNPGMIGDLVWVDANEDGAFDPVDGDQTMPGVTLRLTDLDNGGQRSATTGLDGTYLFNDLPPGNYTVEVTDSFGVLDAYTMTVAGPDNRDQPYAVSLPIFSPVHQNADFGYALKPTGIPGDCNKDDAVNAGDISALVLEIFDGDGALPTDAPGGTFSGNAVGCDTNGDAAIDAGDISCTVLMIFNGPGACTQTTGADAANVTAAGEPDATQNVTLSIPRQIPTEPGGTVDAPIAFKSQSNEINAMTLSVDFDTTWLSLDETDSDGDGIPDAIIIDVPAAFSKVVIYDPTDTDGELDIALFTLTSGVFVPDGIPMTITFDVGTPAVSTEAAIKFSTDPAPSFGAANGESIPGSVENGSALIIVDGMPLPSQHIFLPIVEAGD